MYVSLEDTERITENSYLQVDFKLNQHLIRESRSIVPYMRTFHQFQRNWEKVTFVYEHMEAYNLVQDIFRADEKNDQEAKRHKRKGDNSFGRGNYILALNHYTRSVMQAKTEEVLAEAYARRSSVLYKLLMYPECIMDTDRAFAHSCPQEMRRNLHMWRARAQEKSRVYTVLPHHETRPPLPSTGTYRDRAHVDTIEQIEVKTDNPLRPRVVARGYFTVGDIISIEHPVAKTVANPGELYRCHHCLKICYNPIPCKVCTQALYCADKCRIAAMSSYHGEECPILRSLRQWVGRCRSLMLAVKMMFLRKHQTFVDEYVRYVEPLENRMCTNQTANKEIYLMALAAGGIFHLIREYTTFPVDESEEYEKEFKNLLFRNLRLCYVFAGGISEIKPVFGKDPEKPLEVTDMDRQFIGCGMYPFYLNFRHSCAPNVVVNHHGAAKVIRALRTVKKGQELFITYGPHFYFNRQAVRQERLLKLYHFECRCRACVGDYQAVCFKAYGVGDPTLNRLINDIRVGWRPVANKGIKEFVKEVKRLERNEQDVGLNFFTGALGFTYDLIGNKRRIP